MSKADDILKSVQKAEAKEGQGSLKIFMGMVAGVGKTFSMLKAAQTLKGQGENPIVGYVETHGRKETEELLLGLTILPRKKIPYKDVYLEEFDIDTCLDLRPKLVLIDELAHTNVPGSRHHKRWQDVLEILNNGIDVYTTLNVQHIESRAETIASLTGVRIHELVPDSVIDRADDIVLIDLIPDEIQERLRQGKIYAPEKVDTATQNFFKLSNLTALREISLRLMAERVDHELKDLSLITGAVLPIKTHYKIMVAIFGSPYSESLIRYTRKLAYTLNCKWIAGYVSNGRNMSEEEKALLDRNMELVKLLGGEVYSTQNDSVSDGILHLAQQNGASQVIVGRPGRGNFFRRFLVPSLAHELIEKAQGIDIHVVSPVRQLSIAKTALPKEKKDFEFDWRSILTTIAYLANLTFINAVFFPLINYRGIGMMYLMGISVGTLFIKGYNVFLAAILGALCWNLFFIPPRFTFQIYQQEDWMLLGLYLVAGLVIGTFTRRLSEKEQVLKSEGQRATYLYNITKDLSISEDLESLLTTAQDQITRLFDCEVSIFLRSSETQEFDPTPADAIGTFAVPPKEEYALQWVIKNRLPAGRFTDTLPSSNGHFVPLLGDKKVIGILALNASKFSIFTNDHKILLDAIARQLASGIRRENLEAELRGKMVSEESERIYKTLLNSVSHETRTPLAVIKGFVETLTNDQIVRDPERVKTMAKEVSKGVERLDYTVKNLLDMSRLESGNLKLHLDYIDIEELIKNAVKKVKRTYGEKEVRFYLEKEMPLFYLDYFLIEQVVENIIRNAFLYTPGFTPIEVVASFEDKFLNIVITDYGPGIVSPDPEMIFNKFFREKPEETGGLGLGLAICKAIVELHRGVIHVQNIAGKGASFTVRLPRELDRELIV